MVNVIKKKKKRNNVFKKKTRSVFNFTRLGLVFTVYLNNIKARRGCIWIIGT